MNKVIAVRNDHQFSYIHKWTDHPNPVEFNLHTHTDYEIYIFLKGDVNFVVEGINYHLKPYDMLLICGSELHRLFLHTDMEYERIIISVSNDFFSEWKCEELTEIFSTDIKKRFIPAEAVRAHDIDENIERIEKYINLTTRRKDTVVKCALVELLYKIGTLTPKGEDSKQNETVLEIIAYLNENLAQQLILDEIAERFFLSKYYMCRIFKKTTGFTIKQYITSKRLLMIKHLFRNGKNLSVASIEAGFGSYTNFYKAYIKEFGVPPKKGLKK